MNIFFILTEMEGKNCLICEEALSGNLGNTTIFRIRPDERDRLICFSKVRMDKKHIKFENFKSLFDVHEQCFKNYLSWEQAIRDREVVDNSAERSSDITVNEVFLSDSHCIFCGSDASDDFIQKGKKKSKTHNKVIITNDTNKIEDMKRSFENINTLNAKKILRRLQNITGTGSIRYHKKCQSSLNVKAESGSSVKQFKTHSEKIYVISKHILKNNDINQFFLPDIMKDEELVKSYSFTEFLKNFFWDSFVYHTTSQGIILSRKEIVNVALNNHWESSKSVAIILRTVANKILDEINAIEFDDKNYPSPENFLDNTDCLIPPTLQSLLNLIIKDLRKHNTKGKSDEQYNVSRVRKIRSICHSIVHAAKPTLISPLMLAIGVFMYRRYGSKELTNLLGSLGFCCSYYEVRLFEASVVLCEQNPIYTDAYIQMIFDNADHNTATIDGKKSFHAMGGAETVTPYGSISFDYVIPKVTEMPKAEVFEKKGLIELLPYDPPIGNKGLATLKVDKILPTDPEDLKIEVRNSDLLWLFGKNLKNFDFPGWNAFMEDYYANESYEKSRVICLPFINNTPTDFDTVYTVINYCEKKRKEFNQGHMFVTFDQSLYIKAREVVAAYSNSPDKNFNKVIVRLGSFHLLMSFMGCVGYIMAGSGLSTILSKVYAEKTVDKILGGHTYSRSIRAFMLINTVLGNHLLKSMQESSSCLTTEEYNFMKKSIEGHGDSLRYAVKDEKFIAVHKKFNTFVDDVEKRGPTAKLWVQLYKMTILIKQLLEADKSGNWSLHLQTIKKMIPFFHMSGHNYYAESAHIYVQDMEKLDLDPAEFAKFVTEGYFTIRRSDKFWSGIPPDQTIEQVVMNDIKAVKGFIRRGVTDSVISKWIASSSILLEVIKALLKYCDLDIASSDQHVDARPARIEKDKKDLLILSEYLVEHDPFSTLPYLIALDTGLIGNSLINCHLAYSLGIEIVENLTNLHFSELHLKRSSKVLPLSAMMSSFKIGNEVITVNPNTVFLRILSAKDKTESLKDYIAYELAPFPAAIFDGVGFYKTEKSVLYNLFDPLENFEFPDNTFAVIDGGHLLHSVIWKPTFTFKQIFQKYCNHLQKYAFCAVVFDGYPAENSTKSFERFRRSKKHFSADQEFLSDEKEAGVSQEDFLSNSHNKVLLIHRLTTLFEAMGIQVIQAAEDADATIVNTAINQSEDYEAVKIVAEDTDLLILLTQFCGDKSNIYFEKPNKKRKPKTIYHPDKFKYKNLKKIVAFLHAFGGSDTTSAFYLKGKEKIFKLMNEKKNENLVKKAEEFFKSDANIEILWEVALRVVTILYGHTETTQSRYNMIRLKHYENLTGDYDIRKLPPTDYAILEHTKRVYLQCQNWSLNDHINPLEWGWKTGRDNILEPVFTSRPLIPDKFLKKFSCGCKKGCMKKCGCRKIGLKCSAFCKSCKGQTCENHEGDSDVHEDNLEEELDTSIFEPNISIDVNDDNYFESTYEDLDLSIFEPNISVDYSNDDYESNMDDTPEVNSVQSMEND